MKNKIERNDNILYFTILTFISIAYGLLSLLTPPQIDDLKFMANYKEFSGDSTDFQLNAILAFARNMWLCDNARFANIMDPIVNLISPWTYIFPWITGLMISLIIWFSLKIINIRENKSVFAALFWGALVLFLPWRNSLFLPDYSLNYIYAGAITLGFTYFLIGRSSLLRNVRVFVGMLIWAFLAGGWHEGFSVPTLAGIAMLILLRICQKSYQKRGWRWYAVIAVYLVVAIYITFCPGVLSRVFRDYSGNDATGFSLKMLVDGFPTIILTIILALTIILDKWSVTMKDALKDAMKNDLFIVIVTASYVSAVISLLFDHAPRMSFYPNLTAIIATIMLLRAPIIKLIERRWMKWLAAITALLCIAHAAHSIRWQYRFDKEYDELMTQFVDEGKSTVFYDIIMPESVDIFTLYFPVRYIWATGFHYEVLGMYLERSDIAVVPTALRNVTMESGEALKSSDEEFPIRRVEDALFTQLHPDLAPIDIIKISLKMKGSDEPIVVDGLALNFVTEAGDSLVYIKPYKIANRQIEEIGLINKK